MRSEQHPVSSFQVMLVASVALVILVVASWSLDNFFQHRRQTVVVNLPADAKPLQTLPVTAETKVITNDRAILWWTVYKATLDRSGRPDVGADAANQAVEKAYGKL